MTTTTLTAEQIQTLNQVLAGGPFPGAVAQHIRDLRNALASQNPEISGADAQFLLRMVGGITVAASAIDMIAGLQDTLQAISAAAGINADPAGGAPQPPRPTPKMGLMPGGNGTVARGGAQTLPRINPTAPEKAS